LGKSPAVRLRPIAVFQDGKGQGKSSVEAAAKLAKGEKVDSFFLSVDPVRAGHQRQLQGVPQQVMLFLRRRKTAAAQSLPSHNTLRVSHIRRL
jgi:hypothetical protein